MSWLPDDLWSRGKCGLKVLQYQAAGLPVVANPVGCQAEMIRPGENGFLATTPDEWVDAVRQLAGDPELRRRMGRPAAGASRRTTRSSAWAETFVDSVTGGAPRRRRRLGLEGRPARPTAGSAAGLRAPRRPGPDPSEPQTGRRPMSVCTPQNDDPRSRARDRHGGSRRRSPAARPPRMFKPPDWDWSGFGEIGWWVRAGSPWRDILLGPGRAPARRVARGGPARHGQVRARIGSSTASTCPRESIYIKHFLVPNRRAMLRQWFRRGKGRNEGKRSAATGRDRRPDDHADRAGRAAEAEVPVRELPGHARRSPTRSRSTSSSSEQLPDWPEPRRSRVRQKLAEALGVMTARLHDAGFLHHDFHPGNILVRFGPPDEPELVDDRPRRPAASAAGSTGRRRGRTWRCSIISSGCAAAGPTASGS